MTSSPKLPQGFKLSTTAAGFRKSGQPDLSFALSEKPAVTAALFTKNLFKAAPVLVGMDLLEKSSLMRGVVINTGQANACTGEEGINNCHKTLELLAEKAGLKANEILPASTGVIGNQLMMDKWEKAIPSLVENLGKASPEDMAKAMMTTDAFPKFSSKSCKFKDKEIIITGMAKGAGMICPNMATMLSLVLCDAEISQEDWQGLFNKAVQLSFNRATVDGDTSTNDTVYGLANGASGVRVEGEDLKVLAQALEEILGELAYMLVQDGEGATKVIHITVSGAENEADAEKAARTVGHSQLVKTAIFGKDANWGRIVAALGRCGVDFKPENVKVSLCGVELFKDGQPSTKDFDSLLKEPLEKRDISIDISLGNGKASYTLLASDLSYDYIKINADYRS